MLYEFTKLKLSEEEFFNLVFMNASPSWESKPDEHKFLLSICGVSLKEVVKKVVEESSYNGSNPTEVFRNIDVVTESSNKPWFERHVSISQCFDKDRMGELWIRNLSDYVGRNGKRAGERKKCPGGSFYVDDGNHRALVYAMHIKFGKMRYNSVNAIHATSWDLASGILNFRPERAASLEHSGELQDKKILRNEFQLPIGIQIKTYKRR
ncbi:hypothetical protein F4009_24230 [Candidatus Poribacteria bacterium]|nr:hypothetical protein [Candidatus Poribacteria bacterium]MYH82781.1 hypothetical protein [Candidatus Poribacteria bacterium]MYK97067.1 hypothetical protein [Candidatus Poribacteria bacterium]